MNVIFIRLLSGINAAQEIVNASNLSWASLQ